MATTPNVTVHLTAEDHATWKLNALAAAACEVCTAYRHRRALTLAMWGVIYGDRMGVAPVPLVIRYLGSVHARHLAGGSLSTRTSTPTRQLDGRQIITVHRVCNGCGTDLGDANDAELDAAQSGAPLPDVRLECGCIGREDRGA